MTISVPACSGVAATTVRDRAVVPLLVVAGLVVLTQLYVSIPLRAPVAADLGDAGVTAALASGYTFFYAVGFLIHGPLSDHVGRRRVLVGGLAALTMTTVAAGFAPSVGVLGVLRAAQGAAAATFAPAALAYLGEALPQRKRAGAIGAMSVAFLTAGIIGQLAAAGVAAGVGWRWVFYGGGLALALVTAGAVALVGEPAVDRPRRPLVGRYADLLRFAIRPRSALLALGHLVVLGGFVGMYTLLGPHLAAAGLTAGEIMAVRGAALPAMFCSLLAGPLIARLGLTRTAVCGFVLAAVGLLAQAALADAVVGLAGASIVFVAGVAVLVPVMITAWGVAAHPARGIGMAVNGFVLFLGAGLGPYATALPSGFATSLVVVAVFYLVGGCVVLSAVWPSTAT